MLLDFAIWQHHMHLAESTIRSALYAVRFRHIVEGYPDPLVGRPRLWLSIRLHLHPLCFPALACPAMPPVEQRQQKRRRHAARLRLSPRQPLPLRLLHGLLRLAGCLWLLLCFRFPIAIPRSTLSNCVVMLHAAPSPLLALAHRALLPAWPEDIQVGAARPRLFLLSWRRIEITPHVIRGHLRCCWSRSFRAAPRTASVR